jgi:hypothetical protein
LWPTFCFFLRIVAVDRGLVCSHCENCFGILGFNLGLNLKPVMLIHVLGALNFSSRSSWMDPDLVVIKGANITLWDATMWQLQRNGQHSNFHWGLILGFYIEILFSVRNAVGELSSCISWRRVEYSCL